WILALRNCAHNDVSIRDDAHKPIVFHYGDRPDVLRFHQPRDLFQRRLRSHSARPTSHHIANFGTHLAPFDVSSLVPGSTSVKPPGHAVTGLFPAGALRARRPAEPGFA